MKPIGEEDEGSEAAANLRTLVLQDTFIPKAPRPVLARWEFAVPGFIPVNLNDTTGKHWSVKDRARKSAADVIAIAARLAGVPHVSWTQPQVRRVRMAFSGWPGGRTMPDPDNLLKYQLDALTTAFLIVDDNAEWCEWEKPILSRSDKPECLIVLEDIEYKPGAFTSEDQLPQMVRLLKGVFRKMGASLSTGTTNPIKAAAKEACPLPIMNRARRRAFKRKGKK